MGTHRQAHLLTHVHRHAYTYKHTHTCILNNKKEVCISEMSSEPITYALVSQESCLLGSVRNRAGVVDGTQALEGEGSGFRLHLSTTKLSFHQWLGGPWVACLTKRLVVVWLSGALTVSLSHKCPERLRLGTSELTVVVSSRGAVMQCCDDVKRLPVTERLLGNDRKQQKEKQHHI